MKLFHDEFKNTILSTLTIAKEKAVDVTNKALDTSPRSIIDSALSTVSTLKKTVKHNM